MKNVAVLLALFYCVGCGIDEGAIDNINDVDTIDDIKDNPDTPTCYDECPTEGQAVCNWGSFAEPEDLISCEDHDLDGCLELGVAQSCNHCVLYDDVEPVVYGCAECEFRDDCTGYPQTICDVFATYTCIPATEWAAMSLDFEGITQTWNDCYYCDVLYNPSNDTAHLRFQMEGGYDQWSLRIDPDPLDPGQYLFDISVNTITNPDLPASQEGRYSDVIDGTISFNIFDLRHGGSIEGELTDVVVQGGNDSTPRTVILNGPFYMEIPE